MHEKTKPKYSISKIAKNIEKEIEDLNFAPKPDKPTTENAKSLKQEIKKELVKKKNNRWRSKPLHGKYPSLIGEPHVDLPNTNNWLRSDIKGETEGLLIAAQDQALYTRNYQKHIVGKEIDSRCRMCYKQSETIDHTQGGYSITFNTGRSMPIFRVRNFTLNQYLGSVNYNMDKNSIFWVHKSEKRKNRGVWCESPRH